MNRKLRFTFRDGDVRMGELPPGQTLVQLWNIFKRDGAVIGDAWCAQFDHVAMIEIIEMPAAENDRPGEQGHSYPPRELQGLAASMSAGLFGPPGKA